MKRAVVVIPTLGSRPGWLLDSARSVFGSDDVATLVVVTTAPATESVTSQLRNAGLERVMVVTQAGQGPAAAIDQGWKSVAESEFVAWIGDDDLLAPGALTKAIDALSRRTRAAMAFGRVRYIRDDGSWHTEVRPGPFAPLLLRRRFNQIAQPGCVYRRSAVDAVGGLDTGCHLAFDLDLHLRLCARFPAVYVPAVLASFRQHPSSLSVEYLEESQREALRVFESRLQPSSRWSDRLLRVAAAVNYKVGTRKQRAA